jgi:hypothetical protein
MQEGRRKPYSASVALRRKSPRIHAADLRHGDVALVDEDERVVGQVFEQRRRRLAGLAAGEIARIVLDAGAGAGGLHHLEIEGGALLEPLRFEQRPAPLSSSRRCFSSALMRLDRLLQRRLRRHVVRVGVDLDEAGRPVFCRSADRTR